MFKKSIQNIAGLFDLSIIRTATHRNFIEAEKKANHLNVLEKVLTDIADPQQLCEAASNSKSQLGQDIFVLSQLSFKIGGYFVEAGATNGIELSNTHMLEQRYKWRGILVEPAKLWHNDLRANRTSKIETRCLWNQSKLSLDFLEDDYPELSTIGCFKNVDFHKNLRKTKNKYPVETITLTEMLDQHEAPKTIDYLSLDTEGSELEILRGLDFSRYQVKVITCEHNYTDKREKIYDFLTGFNFTRIFQDISKHDDWYIRNS